jgi:hypothetical protein
LRWRLSACLVLVALVAAFFVLESPALAGDREAVYGILAKHKSPLPAETIVAFAESHPEFDIAGYLAVMWAESSLGKGCDYKCNPGSIRGGKVGSLWRDARIGVSRAGYNVYPDIYTGQRAAIRLLWERGYNELLAADNWWGFANRYYGRGVPGIGRYVANLRAAHSIIVREAAQWGARDW